MQKLNVFFEREESIDGRPTLIINKKKLPRPKDPHARSRNSLSRLPSGCRTTVAGKAVAATQRGSREDSRAGYLHEQHTSLAGPRSDWHASTEHSTRSVGPPSLDLVCNLSLSVDGLRIHQHPSLSTHSPFPRLARLTLDPVIPRLTQPN